MDTADSKRHTGVSSFVCWLLRRAHLDRNNIPVDLRKSYRGCKAGAKLKARLADNQRRFKPTIPSMIMRNVNSLPNKMDELAALENQQIYRQFSLFS